GLSENIRVRSILGRFLEHSRLLHVAGGGNEEYWMGSADAMHRNLDRRVEAMLRVLDPTVCGELADVLDLAWSDDVSAWELQPDGEWVRHKRVHDYQEELIHRQRHLVETPAP